MPTRNVLIPLDGSELSRKVIPHITRLFHPSETALILLRVADRPEGLVGEPPRPVSLVWAAPMYASEQDVERTRHPIYASQSWASVCAMLEDELVPIVHDLRAAGFSASVATRFGDPMEEIVRFAKDEGVDLVAMATHGRTGLPHLVLGSVAEGVLHRLHIPVLLIRPFDHLMDGQDPAGDGRRSDRRDEEAG